MKDNQPMTRILLVDDDPDVLKVYARVLRIPGWIVDTAENGRRAVEQVRATSYDAIVSDVSMPQMDGLQFLRALRQHDLDVPVILVTGAPHLEAAVAAVEYGAFRYLAKPVSPDSLIELVRRASSLSQMARLKREALDLVGSEGKQLGDRASLDSRFSNALDLLWVANQPIVRSRARSVFAYEALVRSDEPSLRGPLDLLDAAERLGRLHDLGRKIRAEVTRFAAEAPPDVLFFINLHPADLNDGELFSPSAPLTSIASRVVMEITERASLSIVDGLEGKIASLRELGFRIAVDDLGAGYAGLSSFSQLEPEFVKLDMSLVRGVNTSARKRSVIRAMVKLCSHELGIEVVSEGVELAQEREVLEADGCELLQGYLFAKPARGFPAPQW